MTKEGLRPEINKENTLGLVLSGGLGRRMGRINKGLVTLSEKPMAKWVMEALAEQTAQVWVSANENEADFVALGTDHVFGDLNDEHQGPLAALEALHNALQKAPEASRLNWVLMAPCDVPFLPKTLLSVFKEKGGASTARAFVIKAGDRSHNTISLIDVKALDTVHDYLARGERRVWGWLDEIGVETVEWPGDPELFANVNTLEECAMLNETLGKNAR